MGYEFGGSYFRKLGSTGVGTSDFGFCLSVVYIRMYIDTWSCFTVPHCRSMPCGRYRFMATGHYGKISRPSGCIQSSAFSLDGIDALSVPLSRPGFGPLASRLFKASCFRSTMYETALWPVTASPSALGTVSIHVEDSRVLFCGAAAGQSREITTTRF
jgi:hypothetical protein